MRLQTRICTVGIWARFWAERFCFGSLSISYARLSSCFQHISCSKKLPGIMYSARFLRFPAYAALDCWTTLMRYFVSANGPILELVQQMGVEISADVAQNGLIGTDRTAFPTLIAINVIPNLIACNLILTGAFNRIPPELFECARLDGISFFRGFIAIAIPLAWPTIVINLISSLSTIFTANGNVFLYTMGQFETATMGILSVLYGFPNFQFRSRRQCVRLSCGCRVVFDDHHLAGYFGGKAFFGKDI